MTEGAATNEPMSDKRRAALAAADALGAAQSRWDNAPGDIVITKRGGKDVAPES